MSTQPTKSHRGTLRPVSVAPMMDRTDRHYRYFLRLISRHTLLYSEMITTGAVIHGDRDRLIGFDPFEGPIALQLGGDDPKAMAECARIAEDRGYDEVNINVGCPSDRVQKGCFGASLMARPERVAEVVSAMRAATALPVTVKHRIGIDDIDRYEDMARFVTIVSEAGADRFSVHARKAWLSGLSPKENRNVPPLRYEDVYRLQREFPHLDIEINGGIRTIEAMAEHLSHVPAVMIGRAAYETPYLFSGVDAAFFGDETPRLSRFEVVEAMLPYVERWVSGGGRLHYISRHMLFLFTGQPGARVWKRHISENAHRKGAGPEVLSEAMDKVRHQQGRIAERAAAFNAASA